ncbi:putative regulator of G-protein signaling 5-like [Scophthalmus maximus]|uniref:Putative regulator of G-protein signaling 5-like n=1 Tax=Scophthalmus maximus TaxID=52904 RepID=A0A2U9BR16_SCOMX|nr:putative regulator of G-protein signaling 5-like [Scophthalmus maximus]
MWSELLVTRLFLLTETLFDSCHSVGSFAFLSGGLHVFRGFLRSEFSEENLEFWLACEDYGVSRSNLQKTKASSIYSQFINPDAPKEVNLDAETREALLSVMDSPCADTFKEAQQKIYNLMAKDSFPRFLRSHQCIEAIKAF